MIPQIITKELLFNPYSQGEVVLNFEFNMDRANKELNLVTKREHYNTIFKMLQKGVQGGNLKPAEYLPQLFKLFEAYATSTCYNQTFNGDRAEGFRKSAKLMEFSLCLQLKHLDLIPQDIMDWRLFDSLDELIHNLRTENQDQGIYFSTFNSLNLDKDVLHQEAYKKEIIPIVRDTLVRLAFSYQNIATLNCPHVNNIALHKKIDALAEKLLEIKSEYAYNRRPFIVGLEKPDDVNAKINSYQELLPLFKNELPEFYYKRKLGQMYNMFGITLAGNFLNNISNFCTLKFTQSIKINLKVQEMLVQARNHFIDANIIHTELLKEASSEEIPIQKFLLANVKGSLVLSLLLADNLDKAKEHVEFLRSYLKELALNKNDQTYQDGYKKVIAIFDEAMKAKG